MEWKSAARLSHAVPAPLRLSLLSDLPAIVQHGCMDRAGAQCTHTYTYNKHTIVSNCSSPLFLFLFSSLLAVPTEFCFFPALTAFDSTRAGRIICGWNVNTVTLSNTHCMLLSAWTLPSSLACGTSGRLSLIMPCWMCLPLFLIFQPVTWLKVDSNLCSSFALLLDTDFLLCPRVLWTCLCWLAVNVPNILFVLSLDRSLQTASTTTCSRLLCARDTDVFKYADDLTLWWQDW